MAKKGPSEKNRKNRTPGGKVELGQRALDNYKARLTKGLLGVGLGEGYIVEILNYRTKRVLRRELFEEPEEAREELSRVREDISKMTTGEFRKKYLQPEA
ncbi:MAG: hypothetical protein JJE48_09200 [Actinobacteria bacterium]|nr:hypothetical protein [Actinomycetota bacterium]